MKNSFLFKISLLAIVGVVALAIFSCKKKSTPSSLVTFKRINIKLGAKARYPVNATGSGTTLTIEDTQEEDSRTSTFNDKNKDNYDIELPTDLFTTATASNTSATNCNGVGDLLLLELELEQGVTSVTVKKEEMEQDGGSSTGASATCSSNAPRGERFSFGVGNLHGNQVTNLPNVLTKENNKDTMGTNGNVVVIRSNITYKTIDSLLKNTQNKVVLSVTATKDGRKTTKH